MTYYEICQAHNNYVIYHYGRAVVFDGYPTGPTTKDATHQRISPLSVGATVKVSESMVFQGNKDEFLSNMINKQRFIHLLAGSLDKSDCHVEHARADADLLIAQNAIDAAHRDPAKPTVVVADDTCILILLCCMLLPQQ